MTLLSYTVHLIAWLAVIVAFLVGLLLFGAWLMDRSTVAPIDDYSDDDEPAPRDWVAWTGHTGCCCDDCHGYRAVAADLLAIRALPETSEPEQAA